MLFSDEGSETRGRSIRLLCAGALALMLAACGGGGSESSVHNTTVSKGQQLIDLKRALDSGAISQSDYNTERAKILASP
jgi:hypothetical protein